jgi:hypothetical protein
MQNRWRLSAIMSVVFALLAVAEFVTVGGRDPLWLVGVSGYSAFMAYRQKRHPINPRPFTRQRVVITLAIAVPVTIAVLAAMVWVAVTVPDLAIRLVACGGVVVVLVTTAAVVRAAKREHEKALLAAAGDSE